MPLCLRGNSSPLGFGSSATARLIQSTESLILRFESPRRRWVLLPCYQLWVHRCIDSSSEPTDWGLLWWCSARSSNSLISSSMFATYCALGLLRVEALHCGTLHSTAATAIGLSRRQHVLLPKSFLPTAPSALSLTLTSVRLSRSTRCIRQGIKKAAITRICYVGLIGRLSAGRGVCRSSK